MLAGGIQCRGGEQGNDQFLEQAKRLGQFAGLMEIDGTPEPESGRGAPTASRSRMTVLEPVR